MSDPNSTSPYILSDGPVKDILRPEDFFFTLSKCHTSLPLCVCFHLDTGAKTQNKKKYINKHNDIQEYKLIKGKWQYIFLLKLLYNF
jgi:hypothetical protein